MQDLYSERAAAKRRLHSRGYALMTFAAVLMVLVVSMGLAVDASILYMVQGKLSGAVDAAALAGAHSLSRGATDDVQIANAQSSADQYVKANFPDGWFGASNLKIKTTVDTTKANVRSVTTNASVDTPLFFMRVLRSGTTNVAASATATRRDSNVVLVMDRSGSLSNTGSCEPLVAAAHSFVDFFSEGHDNVGLVTFGTSSAIDFPARSDFKSSNSPKAALQILDPDNFTCIGGTNTPSGLWQGYQALAKLGQPGALNVIVLFTDGQPTAVTAAMKPYANCTDKTHVRNAAITIASGSSYQYWGLLDPVGRTQPMSSDTNKYTDYSSGCKYTGDFAKVDDDFNLIPFTDVYDNSMNTTYQGPLPSKGGTAGFKLSQTSSEAQNFLNACYNAAKDAADRIHNGDTVTGTAYAPVSNIVIFTVGYAKVALPADADDLLMRISNDPHGTTAQHNKAWPEGMYIKVVDPADLKPAFIKVASLITRLEK